jgi:hypothetical protein
MTGTPIKNQTTHTAFIIALPIVFLFLWIAGCSKSADANAENSAETPQPAAVVESAQIDKVVVYYFHNTRRCPTCLGIQKGIEQTIDAKFGRDIEAGMLEFMELNMDEEVNQKYVEQFQLSFSTMIVSAESNGKAIKWTNAGKVWDLAHAPDDLHQYVEKMIRQKLDLFGRTL